MAQPVLVLDNPIQNYAWGSRTAIADFLGRPAPSALPEAELWIGAHPKAPSRVVAPAGLGTLDRVIQDDPIGSSAPRCATASATSCPSSSRCWRPRSRSPSRPTPATSRPAAAGRARTPRASPWTPPAGTTATPTTSPSSSARSTPFTALKGFRPLDEIARNLEPVARPEIAPELGRLAREQTPLALRALFARLMTLDPEEQAPVLKRATGEAARRRRTDRAWEWVARPHDALPGRRLRPEPRSTSTS